MAVDPITNPERLALQPMMQEVHSATTLVSQGNGAHRADWLNAWNQQLQAPEWAPRTQLETALPTNWL